MMPAFENTDELLGAKIINISVKNPARTVAQYLLAQAKEKRIEVRVNLDGTKS